MLFHSHNMQKFKIICNFATKYQFFLKNSFKVSKECNHILIISLVIHFSLAFSGAEASTDAKFKQYDHEVFSRLQSSYLLEKGTDFVSDSYAQPDSAMLCYSIITSRFENDENKNDASVVFAAYLNMGTLWREVYYDYPHAYSANYKALNLADKYNLNWYKPYAYLGLADVLQHTDSTDNDFEQPFQLIKNGLDGAIKTSNYELIIYAICNLCEYGINGNRYDLVAPELEKVKNLEFPDSVYGVEYTNYFIRAIECMGREDFTGMHRNIDLAIEWASQDNHLDPKLYYVAMRQKVSALKLSQTTDSIPELLKTMLTQAEKDGFQEYELYSLEELRDYYRNIGDTETAHNFEFRFLKVNDSVQRIRNIGGIRDMSLVLRLEESQNQVRMLINQKYKDKVTAIIITSISVFIIILLAYYIYTQRHLKKINISLYNRLQDYLKKDSLSNQIPKDISTAEKDLEHHNIFADAEDMKTEEDGNVNEKSIDKNDRSDEIYHNVISVMETSNDIFDPDFTIKNLASMINVPYYEVSAIINSYTHASFKAMLLDYRLKEACRRLSDTENYGNMTVESIALSLGFKSRAYFNSVFKKYAGMTPAVYMKIAHTEKS